MTILPLPLVLLFDLDDTIIASRDREPLLAEVIDEFVPEIPLSRAELHAGFAAHRDWLDSQPVRDRIASPNAPRTTMREFAAAAFARMGLDHPDVVQAFADRYRNVHINSGVLFDGAVETLVALRARGLRLGLVTNGSVDWQWPKIERFNLRMHFECIAVEGDLGMGKPDPRVFYHVLSAMRAEPSDGWMVGDSLADDVAAAQAVGLRGIWHDWAEQGLPADTLVEPDQTIVRIRELLGALPQHGADQGLVRFGDPDPYDEFLDDVNASSRTLRIYSLGGRWAWPSARCTVAASNLSAR